MTPTEWLVQQQGFKWSSSDDGGHATIKQWLADIAAAYPEMAAYCNRLANEGYFPWCGAAAARAALAGGYRPPFGGTDEECFAWAPAWDDWGGYVPHTLPQQGDFCRFAWATGGEHISTFYKDNEDGTWEILGGNQGHGGVNVESVPASACVAVRRPSAAAGAALPSATAAVTLPTKPASQFDTCLAFVLQYEGGYSNDAGDSGGPTNFGITIADYRNYINPNGTADDVASMTVDQAKPIYRAHYWNALLCDLLPTGVDFAVFDYGVNSGISRAAKLLQSLVGTNQDGEIGPLTVAATAKADPATLIKQICDQRMAFLQGLSIWGTFGHGWTTRVNSVRTNALAMVSAPKPPPATGVPPVTDPTPAPMPTVIPPAGQAAVLPGLTPIHLPSLDQLGAMLTQITSVANVVQQAAQQAQAAVAAVQAAKTAQVTPIAPTGTPTPASTFNTMGLGTGLLGVVVSLLAHQAGMLGAPIGDTATVAGQAATLGSLWVSVMGAFGKVAPFLSAIGGALASLAPKKG